MPRDRRGYKLVAWLSTREAQELFALVDSLGGPLYEKLKAAIASAVAEQSRGSFLWNVMMTYGCDRELARMMLREQYRERGSTWMQKHWGFTGVVIRKGLRELGIRTRSRLYNNAPHGLACEAFARYGGIENVLRRFKTEGRFSSICKVHSTTLGNYLRKKGYRYNRNTGRWEKCQNLTL